jgi:hypothetical protein
MICVIGHSQTERKRHISLEPSHRRLTYSYQLGGPQDVHAVDDNGIQTLHPQPRERRQVALLKAKKGYQDSGERVPDITDGLLREMVGGALALRQSCQRTREGELRTEGVLRLTPRAGSTSNLRKDRKVIISHMLTSSLGRMRC